MTDYVANEWEIVGVRPKLTGGRPHEFKRDTIFILYDSETNEFCQLTVDIGRIPPYASLG